MSMGGNYSKAGIRIAIPGEAKQGVSDGCLKADTNAAAAALLGWAAACASRKLISHSIKPPTVHNDDVGHRLLVVYYLSKRWRLHRSRFRTIHPQRQMRTPVMIIIEIACQNSFQMALVQYDNVIQTISPDAANHAFYKCILPRTSRR